MKLLILGESDSAGGGLSDRSQAWGERVPVELEERFGLDIESTHVRFYAHSPNCMDYLETVLANGPFDTVLFSITTIGFTLLSTDNRVRRLLGKRAGDWLKNSTNSFDRKTRPKGTAGLRRRLNRGVHTLARNVIGQEPPASYETVLENHGQICARLARLEDTEVLLLGPTNHGARLAKITRKTQPSVDSFRQAVREESERRRFLWLDRQMLSLAARDRDAEFTDGLHKTAGFHGRIAEAAVDMLAARLELAGHRELWRS